MYISFIFNSFYFLNETEFRNTIEKIIKCRSTLSLLKGWRGFCSNFNSKGNHFFISMKEKLIMFLGDKANVKPV